MKKFLIGLVALFSISIAGHAQTTAATPKTAPVTTKTASTATVKKDHAVAAKTATTTTVKPSPATTGTAAVTKKDGTPDMRYKANKNAAAAKKTTHVKKDGTPDQRFKENKKAS